MDDQDSQAAGWLGGLPVEDDRAARMIFDECFDRLVASANEQRKGVRHGDADGEDLASSVLGSFFRGVDEGRISGRLTRAQLWGLVWTIARRKIAKRRRQRHTLRRGAGRVHTESDLAHHTDGLRPLDYFSSGSTDEQALFELRDHLWSAVESLGDPVCQTVLVMRLAGHSHADIAASLTCSTRTVERKIERIQRVVNRLD